jgi:hypothetical protein
MKLYQAKAGDGLRKKGLKRADTFFKTPLEAASEALSIKGKLDAKYQNEIQWDYDAAITGSREKAKILRGYLSGDRGTNPFYLEILSVDKPKKGVSAVSPLQPKSITTEDQKVLDNVNQLFSIKN